MLIGLLKTIFFILLFYYGFKFLARLLAPFLIKKATETIKKKAAKHYKEEYQNTVQEGETVIDKKPGSQQQNKKTVGEYVDFEEID